jgi:hypothetical protein
MCTFLDRRSTHVAKRDFCEALRNAKQRHCRPARSRAHWSDQLRRHALETLDPTRT